MHYEGSISYMCLSVLNLWNSNKKENTQTLHKTLTAHTLEVSE